MDELTAERERCWTVERIHRGLIGDWELSGKHIKTGCGTNQHTMKAIVKLCKNETGKS